MCPPDVKCMIYYDRRNTMPTPQNAHESSIFDRYPINDPSKFTYFIRAKHIVTYQAEFSRLWWPRPLWYQTPHQADWLGNSPNCPRGTRAYPCRTVAKKNIHNRKNLWVWKRPLSPLPKPEGVITPKYGWVAKVVPDAIADASLF